MDRDDLKSWSKNDLIREVMRLREIASQVLSRSGTEALEFESGVNVEGKAFVRMWWGDQSGQITVDEAYQHAQHVTETAAAAAFDAAFFRLYRDKLDVGDNVLWQMLVDMRQYRDELGFDASERRSGHTTTTLRPERRP